MRVLVIGATGTIGRAVTNLLKQRGHEVIEASRSSHHIVDITKPSSIDQLYKSVGTVDAIITAAGDAAFAALDKLTEQEIQFTLLSKLMGQINVVRKGINFLSEDGVAIITGGMLAYEPWPNTSMITMVNAGLEGFARAASLDLKQGKRILIVHPPWVAETASALNMDPSPWPNASDVAVAYIDALEGKESGQPIFVKAYEPVK